MRFLLLVSVLVLILSGCATTRIVSSHSTKSHVDTLDYSEVQTRVGDGTIKVILRDGRAYTGTDARVAADSVRCIVEPERKVRVVAAADVLRIEKANHVDGAIGGFLIGGIGGGFLGLGYGKSVHRNDGSGLAVVFSVIAGAVLGAIGGAIYGGVQGAIVEYQFPGDSGVPIDQQSVKRDLP